MATIQVTGKTKAYAPGPMTLKSWWEDWNPQLTNLTAWVSTGDGTIYTCTATDPVATVTQAVQADLKQWCPNSPAGNCTWQIY